MLSSLVAHAPTHAMSATVDTWSYVWLTDTAALPALVSTHRG
jgi:hypothetical protein